MPLATGCRVLVLVALALSMAACPPRLPTIPARPAWSVDAVPPAGPGAAEPQRVVEPKVPWLDVEALADAGWEPVVVLVLPTRRGPSDRALVAARALDGSASAWLLVHSTDPAAQSILMRFAVPEPPIPLWSQLGPQPDQWMVVAEQAAVSAQTVAGSVAGGWAIEARREPPRAELLWEALEPADTLAAVSLDPQGPLEVVSVRWHEVCPDPLDSAPAANQSYGTPLLQRAEGHRHEPPANPCLLVRAWSGGDGVPRTWRTGPLDDGRVASLGQPHLDRIVGLVLALDCRYVDLRETTVRREVGLVAAGEEGELVESVRCLDPAEGLFAAVDPYVVLLESGDGTWVPAGRALSLRGTLAEAEESAERWSRGYRLLPDLNGDGVRDWLWLERSEAGTRHIVTRGPEGFVAGTLFVDAGGELVERLVVPPPGGRAVLEALDWRPAPDPAALLDVRLEAADGTARTERIVVPLVFR